jgi:hypothetical protein
LTVGKLRRSITRMTQETRTRVGAAVGVGLVALQLTACGATIKPEGAEKAVSDLVANQTGFRPTDVKCPSGVDAKVDVKFDCVFTGPEGKNYIAHLRITKVEGDDVEFDIKTNPAKVVPE